MTGKVVVVHSNGTGRIDVVVVEPLNTTWDTLTEDRVCSGYFPAGTQFNTYGATQNSYIYTAGSMEFEMDLTDNPQSCTIGIVAG